jgi:hypothetical protein
MVLLFQDIYASIQTCISPSLSINTLTMSFGEGTEKGYLVWISLYAPQTQNQSHQVLSSPPSYRSWHIITQPKKQVSIFLTMEVQFSLSMLCGRPPYLQSIGYHSARDITLSQGHQLLTSQSQMGIKICAPQKNCHLSG